MNKIKTRLGLFVLAIIFGYCFVYLLPFLILPASVIGIVVLACKDKK
jgi:hypothetical protein